jgi:hypothetical protein
MSATLHFSNARQPHTYTDQDGASRSYPSPVSPNDDSGDYLNMSNGNAVAFLAALGLDTDFWDAPSMQVREFEAACRRFLTSDLPDYVDRGTPTVTHAKPGCATIVQCGRPEGYMVMRVSMALRLTGEAIAKGATHCHFS